MTYKKSSLKIFLIIFFLGLIAIVGLTSYFISKKQSSVQSINRLAPTNISTINWKTYDFKQIGFSFKIPSDWTVLSNQDISSAKVKLEIINDNNPTGQYYNEKIISGPSFFMGPKLLIEKYKLPEDYQKLSSLTTIINGNFLFNGLLNEKDYISGKTHSPKIKNNIKYTKLGVNNKVIILAELGLIKEAFIPLSNFGVGKFALILSAEDISKFKILDQIVSTFKFLK